MSIFGLNIGVDDIQQSLSNLPLESATKTFTALEAIRSMSYAVDSKFGEIGRQKQVVDKVVEAIRKYEFNGLQLSGNACWVLLKICENGDDLVLSQVASSSVVELLLRISFQQPISTICSHTLSLLVFRHASGATFRELCETTITIKDELAAPIPAVNFISYFDLVRSGIARMSRVVHKDSHVSVEAALRALHAICPLVDNRRNHLQSGGGGGSGDSIEYNLSNLLDSIGLLPPVESDLQLSFALNVAFLDALTGLAHLNPAVHPSIILSRARFNNLSLVEFVSTLISPSSSIQIITSIFRLVGALSWSSSDSTSASLLSSKLISLSVALESVQLIKHKCFSPDVPQYLPRMDIIARGYASILLSSSSAPDYTNFNPIMLSLENINDPCASEFIYCYADMLHACLSDLSQPYFSWNRLACIMLGVREICSHSILCPTLISLPSKSSSSLLVYDMLREVELACVKLLTMMASNEDANRNNHHSASNDDDDDTAGGTDYPQLSQSSTRTRSRRDTAGRYSFQGDFADSGIGACGVEASIVQGFVSILSAIHGRRRYLVFKGVGDDGGDDLVHELDQVDILAELVNVGLLPNKCLVDLQSSWDEMVPMLLNANVLRLHVMVHALAWFGCGLSRLSVSECFLGHEYALALFHCIKPQDEAGDDEREDCKHAILGLCEVLHEIMSDERHGVTDQDGMLLVLFDIFSILFEALEMFKRADDDDDEKKHGPPNMVDNPSLALNQQPTKPANILCSCISDNYGCHSSFCFPNSCFSRSCYGFHHPQARWRIVRPYRQQRGQKTCAQLPGQEFRTSLIDKVGDLLHSEWNSCHDWQFAISTTRLIRALSYVDDVPRRSIAKYFAKVHDMVRSFMGDIGTTAFLLGCIRDMVTPIMHKFSPMEEVLLTDLMLDCLCCHKSIALQLSVCEIINCLRDEEHGNFVQRNLSRRETEDKVMQIFSSNSKDPYYRVVCLKTLAVMGECYYDKPFHVYASWSFPIALRKRRQIREDVGCNMVTKCLAAHPYDVLSIAHGLSFATGLYSHAKLSEEKAGINVQSRNTRFVLMSMLNPDDSSSNASEGTSPIVSPTNAHHIASATSSSSAGSSTQSDSDSSIAGSIASTAAQESKDAAAVNDDDAAEKAFIDEIAADGDDNDSNGVANGSADAVSSDVKSDSLKVALPSVPPTDSGQTSAKMSSILEAINASTIFSKDSAPTELDESEKRNRRNFKIDFGNQLKNSLVAKDAYMDKFTPLIPNALAFLTSNMQIHEDDVETASRMTGVVSRVSTALPSSPSMKTTKTTFVETEDISDRGLLEEEEKEKEVLALSTFKALETFLSDDLANPFERYKDMLGTQSIGQAIPVVMIRFPENVEIQQHGLAVIAEFAVHGVELSLLGESLCQALGVAVFSCPQDRQIHKHFAVIVKYMGALSSGSRLRQLFFATETHKWLYIVLQCAWRDVNADACAAVANLISDDDESGKILGQIGCAELVVRIMMSQTIDYQVQYQGMRALNALCKTPENLVSFKHLLRSSGPGNAKSVVSHAKKVLRGHREGADLLKQFSQTLSASTQTAATGNAGKPPCVVS